MGLRTLKMQATIEITVDENTIATDEYMDVVREVGIEQYLIETTQSALDDHECLYEIAICDRVEGGDGGWHDEPRFKVSTKIIEDSKQATPAEVPKGD